MNIYKDNSEFFVLFDKTTNKYFVKHTRSRQSSYNTVTRRWDFSPFTISIRQSATCVKAKSFKNIESIQRLLKGILKFDVSVFERYEIRKCKLDINILSKTSMLDFYSERKKKNLFKDIDPQDIVKMRKAGIL
jgi:hypothetical protein